jgi:diguanylate cyclase (GGDEF)-like protein
VHAVTQGRVTATATVETPGPARLPWRGHVPGSFREAICALRVAEARLNVALRSQERMRAENELLMQSLEAASRRAVAAQRIAHHDVLTGLPNRLFLIRRVQKAIAAAAERGPRFALLFIDLDGFKSINDRLGHAVADRLLAAVALRIAACVRSDDVACRYGGDEFVALLADVGNSSIAMGVSQKVREHIAEIYTIAGNEIRITASIGVAVYPDQGHRYDTLLSHADAAMYRDKETRRERDAVLESQDSLHAWAGRVLAVGPYR